jgi:uncharacterized protein
MKFVMLVLAVLVLVWLLRSSLRRMQQPPPASKGKAADAGAPQPMLSCAHCGLHLPRDEALPGRGGVFCGAAHRAAYEAVHPQP